MLRRTTNRVAAVAVGLLLTLASGAAPERSAEAQEALDAQAELVDRLLTDSLTREEMVGLYQALAGAPFQPPACVAGQEMFTDVPASSPFCPWIEELARRGITGGCGGGKYCPGNPVSRGQMAVFVVKSTTGAEPFRIVGAPGEPAFGKGGAGDCLWGNPPPEALHNPTSFFKDSDGVVHLAGRPMASDGPGGDTVCGPSDDFSDHVIFELPAGYQPAHMELFLGLTGVNVGTILIAPVGGLMIGEVFIPGGSVVTAAAGNGNLTALDGFTFRAAPATTTATTNQLREPASIAPQTLRDLLD